MGKPVVLVLVNGKPFTLAWEAENIPAILETWYPGEEGGNATANLIFGEKNPSGRLPITFPRHVGQLPLRYNYETSGRGYDYYDLPFTPLYRFGHGLSYTSFKYSNLKATPKQDDPGFVSVSVDVENTGERPGDEVAQLYITDSFASVVTPVIELKGFKRVALEKGEKKTLTFELTPYDLSLLDAGMVRVLEPGQFRVHVGGVSPEPPSTHVEHKSKIGFANPAQGISGEFEVPRKYAADFRFEIDAPAKAKGGEPVPVKVTVKNEGNLLDVCEVKFFGDDTLLGTRRFEIDPGQSRTHTFKVPLFRSGAQNLNVMVGTKLVGRSISVSKVPAKLELIRPRLNVDENGVLRYVATARNVGSDPYKAPFAIQVDGKEVITHPLTLAPGEQQDLALSHPLPRAGIFRVKIGTGTEQQVTVPGGLRLALKEKPICLDFEEADASGVKELASGAKLPFEGKPEIVEGKTGKGFRTADVKTYVKPGKVDFYRKSFTLASWIKVEKYGAGDQAAFFGGSAPMGADVDEKGTTLFAGVRREDFLLSFLGRDVQGGKPFPAGTWFHATYTYDAELQQGTIYLNGRQVGSKNQEPFVGQLDMIGSSQRFSHGDFVMDDVLVAAGCLPPSAVLELSSKNLEALRAGTFTTEWRPLSGVVREQNSFADLPAGTSGKLTVEIGDGQGKVIGSKVLELKSGETRSALENLDSGAKVRLKVELASTVWGAVPVLQSAVLTGAGEPMRWSTATEWKKGNARGGLQIAQ